MMQFFWKLKWKVYRKYLTGFSFIRGGHIRYKSNMDIKSSGIRLRLFGMKFNI